MATSLSVNVDLKLDWLFQNPIDLETIKSPGSYQVADSLANGTVIDAADLIWTDRRSVASGTPDDIDLAGGVTSAFGVAMTFAKIKGILIRNNSTTAGQILEVGGDANALASLFGDASDKIKIGPNGILLNWNPSLAGFAVTASTGDVLQIASASGTISYDIIVIGTSA